MIVQDTKTDETVSMESAGGVSRRRLARTPETAKYIGNSKSFLDQGRVSGTGPPYIKVGSNVIYDLDDVDTWLDQNRHTSTSDNGIVTQP